MMDAFKELLMKKSKEQGPVDEKKMSAKAMVMKELSDMLGDGMKNDMVDGLKKVTVASNSPEGLEKGIDLAKKKVEEMQESPEEEEMESPEEEMSEDEASEEHEPSADEDSEIAELEKKIAELKAKKK